MVFHNSFENLGTDYKIIGKKIDSYTEPVPKTVGVSEDTKLVNGNVEMTLNIHCLT